MLNSGIAHITIQFNENINTNTTNQYPFIRLSKLLHNSVMTFNTGNNTAKLIPIPISESVKLIIVTQRVKSVTNDSLENHIRDSTQM
jgi:hypothetical protein